MSDKFRNSYIAVIDRNCEYVYERVSVEPIYFSYEINTRVHTQVDVVSVGFNKEKQRQSNIIIHYNLDGNEKGKINREVIDYSLGKRGLNIVVFSRKLNVVIDTFNVDFYGDKNLTINRYF